MEWDALNTLLRNGTVTVAAGLPSLHALDLPFERQVDLSFSWSESELDLTAWEGKQKSLLAAGSKQATDHEEAVQAQLQKKLQLLRSASSAPVTLAEERQNDSQLSLSSDDATPREWDETSMMDSIKIEKAAAGRRVRPLPPADVEAKTKVKTAREEMGEALTETSSYAEGFAAIEDKLRSSIGSDIGSEDWSDVNAFLQRQTWRNRKQETEAVGRERLAQQDALSPSAQQLFKEIKPIHRMQPVQASKATPTEGEWTETELKLLGKLSERSYDEVLSGRKLLPAIGGVPAVPNFTSYRATQPLASSVRSVGSMDSLHSMLQKEGGDAHDWEAIDAMLNAKRMGSKSASQMDGSTSFGGRPWMDKSVRPGISESKLSLQQSCDEDLIESILAPIRKQPALSHMIPKVTTAGSDAGSGAGTDLEWKDLGSELGHRMRGESVTESVYSDGKSADSQGLSASVANVERSRHSAANSEFEIFQENEGAEDSEWNELEGRYAQAVQGGGSRDDNASLGTGSQGEHTRESHQAHEHEQEYEGEDRDTRGQALPEVNAQTFANRTSTLHTRFPILPREQIEWVLKQHQGHAGNAALELVELARLKELEEETKSRSQSWDELENRWKGVVADLPTEADDDPTAGSFASWLPLGCVVF
jgi:hypothetical protein